jgi:hypothetical protein
VVTDCAAAEGHTVSVSHVCMAAVVATGVDGAALSVVTRVDRRSLVHATDQLGRQLDDLQFTLGEGPCVEGWSLGGLVLAGDLADSVITARWPLFAPATLAAGVRAVFGFPLQMAAIRLGTLGLYRKRPGPLGDEQLADMLTLCGAAVAMMVAATNHSANGVQPPSGVARGPGRAGHPGRQARGVPGDRYGRCPAEPRPGRRVRGVACPRLRPGNSAAGYRPAGS